jgi:glycerol-3-phosphate acyltransferase PlsY
MSTPVVLGAMMLVAYVLGSIPWGLVIARTRGIDPRTAGSGNIGATNVARLLGGKYFALVFTLDWLKGFLPILAASAWVRTHEAHPTWDIYLLWLGVGLAAILGHVFSLFIGFKGGKGVATSAGVMLGLYPYYTVAGVAGVLVWAVVFWIWCYISLASICGALAFPVLYLLAGWVMGWPVLGQQSPLLVVGVVIAALVVWKHRGNIARLRAGTENRAGPRAAPRS